MPATISSVAATTPPMTNIRRTMIPSDAPNGAATAYRCKAQRANRQTTIQKDHGGTVTGRGACEKFRPTMIAVHAGAAPTI
jgi:hypothetical protein